MHKKGKENTYKSSDIIITVGTDGNIILPIDAPREFIRALSKLIGDKQLNNYYNGSKVHFGRRRCG